MSSWVGAMSCLAACLDALNPRETRGARVAGALS
jgi:hypothetical protein